MKFTQIKLYSLYSFAHYLSMLLYVQPILNSLLYSIPLLSIHNSFFVFLFLLKYVDLQVYSKVIQVHICTYIHIHNIYTYMHARLVASVMSSSLQPHGLGPLPGSSVHGISQERRLEWVAISFSTGSFQPRYQTSVSCVIGRFFTTEPPGKPHIN